MMTVPPDDRIIPDCCSTEDQRIGTNPDIIADDDRPPAHDTAVAFLRLQRVYHRADARVRADKHIVADGHIGFVEYRQVEIAREIIAYMDIKAEITSKWRIDDATVADTLEYLAQQLVAPFFLRRRDRIEFIAQLLAATKGRSYLVGKTVNPLSGSQSLKIICNHICHISFITI